MWRGHIIADIFHAFSFRHYVSLPQFPSAAAYFLAIYFDID